MSISSELTALQTDITNARTAITNKGGTVTVNGGSSQLATDIGTIPPSYIPRNVVSGKLTMPSGTYTLPSNITDLDDYTLRYAFANSNITTVDLSSLTTLTVSFSFDSFLFCFLFTELTAEGSATLTDFEESASFVCFPLLFCVSVPDILTTDSLFD